MQILAVTLHEEAGSPQDPGFNGQIITAMKDACLAAVLWQPVRLMTAFYGCDLLVSASALGKVYNVLTQRNAKILWVCRIAPVL